MRKLLFLDIDGVLATAASVHLKDKYYQTPFDKSFHHYPFATSCVEALNCALKESEAEVVISSAWRMFGLDAVKFCLEHEGVKANVIGETPETRTDSSWYVPNRKLDSYISTPRGLEIQAWLDQNKATDAKIVIVDDCTDMVHLKKRLVKTSWEKGLEMHHTFRIISMLKEEKA